MGPPHHAHRASPLSRYGDGGVSGGMGAGWHGPPSRHHSDRPRPGEYPRGRLSCLASGDGGQMVGGLGYPFCLDPFLAFLGRAPTFWATFSEISACFALIRADTASSKVSTGTQISSPVG